jgi:hypothetical protein
MDYSQGFDADLEDPDSPFRKLGFVDRRSQEAEFFNLLLDSHISNKVIRWNCYRDIGWVFELEDMVLDVENVGTETFTVRATSGSMPRVYINPLRQELRQLLSTALKSQEGILGFAVTLLQLVETAVIHVHEWKYREEGEVQSRGWDPKKVSEEDIFENPFGVNLDMVDDSAFHLLGKSVKELWESFEDDGFRVLHVENGLRNDLVKAFQKRQSKMLEQVTQCSYKQLRPCVSQETIKYGSSMDNRDDLARQLCQPRPSFHGTDRCNIPSIVRLGFDLPGQKVGDRTVGIAFGSSFGRGIYTSPNVEYALVYSEWSEKKYTYGKIRSSHLPGLRLIICVILMGRTLQVTRDLT